MKLIQPLLILLLSADLTLSLQCDANNIWPEGCDVSDSVCQIDCQKTVNKADCSPTCKTEVGLGSAVVSYEEMSEEKCRQLCETSMKEATEEASRCRFWRYVST